jgi:hypothetical protein
MLFIVTFEERNRWHISGLPAAMLQIDVMFSAFNSADIKIALGAAVEADRLDKTWFFWEICFPAHASSCGNIPATTKTVLAKAFSTAFPKRALKSIDSLCSEYIFLKASTVSFLNMIGEEDFDSEATVIATSTGLEKRDYLRIHGILLVSDAYSDNSLKSIG